MVSQAWRSPDSRSSRCTRRRSRASRRSGGASPSSPRRRRRQRTCRSRRSQRSPPQVASSVQGLAPPRRRSPVVRRRRPSPMGRGLVEPEQPSRSRAVATSTRDAATQPARAATLTAPPRGSPRLPPARSRADDGAGSREPRPRRARDRRIASRRMRSTSALSESGPLGYCAQQAIEPGERAADVAALLEAHRLVEEIVLLGETRARVGRRRRRRPASAPRRRRGRAGGTGAARARPRRAARAPVAAADGRVLRPPRRQACPSHARPALTGGDAHLDAGVPHDDDAFGHLEPRRATVRAASDRRGRWSRGTRCRAPRPRRRASRRRSARRP